MQQHRLADQHVNAFRERTMPTKRIFYIIAIRAQAILNFGRMIY